MSCSALVSSKNKRLSEVLTKNVAHFIYAALRYQLHPRLYKVVDGVSQCVMDMDLYMPTIWHMLVRPCSSRRPSGARTKH